MTYCAILGCKNKSGSHNLTKGGVSYHRFPNCQKIKDEWISATGRRWNWMPSKSSTICSVHFQPDNYVVKDGGRRYLDPCAIPSRDVATLMKSPAKTIQKQADKMSYGTNTTSIEVEIMPENIIIINPQRNRSVKSCKADSSMSPGYSRTHEEDKMLLELMQTKIEEQELLIRKLKVRNYRLKKRLFSLKSMENND